MAEKTTEYEKLKRDLAAGSPGTLYVMYGKETYLRDETLASLRSLILAEGFEEFNYKRFEEDKTPVREIAAAVDTLPVFAARTLVEVRDFDLFGADEARRAELLKLVSDLPEYCCLVFVYDALEFRKGSDTKLYNAVKKNGSIVEFSNKGQSELLEWIRERFNSLGKDISRQDAEYLVFLCGSMMAGLYTEIDKIASYAREKQVTRSDIDAAAIAVPEAVVFKMTDAIADGNYDRACGVLSELLRSREPPIKLLAIIGSQIRKIYTAKLALGAGKNALYLMDIYGMRSDYPAKKLLNSAKRISLEWCRRAAAACADADMRLKSTSADGEEELARLMVELALC